MSLCGVKVALSAGFQVAPVPDPSAAQGSIPLATYELGQPEVGKLTFSPLFLSKSVDSSQRTLLPGVRA